MRTTNLTFAVALSALFVAACKSGDDKIEGTVEKSQGSYRNSFDFVWQSAQDELSIAWRIEKADLKTKTITTQWNTNMSPFSRQGRRDRLVVTVSGDNQSGWRATAEQESQTNAYQKDPLNEAKAEWKELANDGGLAAKFLQNLDTRLQPDETWRDRVAR
jgi:hypothetical protein